MKMIFEVYSDALMQQNRRSKPNPAVAFTAVFPEYNLGGSLCYTLQVRFELRKKCDVTTDNPN